eukprot:349892-Pelagomonas_calceolata.AAC.1
MVVENKEQEMGRRGPAALAGAAKLETRGTGRACKAVTGTVLAASELKRETARTNLERACAG